MIGALALVCACGGGGAGSDTDDGGTGTSAASQGPTGSGPGGDPTGDACEGGEHSGDATYYGADGSGNCSFPAGPDPMVAAMNDADYAGSGACGACASIQGPDGQITVKIVDRCPGCPQGDIDLSEAAFAMIAAPELGRVPITWRYVSCDAPGPIVYHFKEGSNQWWTAVQIRGHRNAIAALEYRDGMGQWKAVQRLDYNYFVEDAGMGPGPYDFRVTDVAGNVLEDAGVPFVEAGDASGAGQFPACAP